MSDTPYADQAAEASALWRKLYGSDSPSATATRLESRERDEELATMIASKMVQAQQAAAHAAANPPPIRRADFDRLPAADRMALVRSGRRIID